MSELSDYKRFCEGPMKRRYEDRISKLVDALEASTRRVGELRKAIAAAALNAEGRRDGVLLHPSDWLAIMDALRISKEGL